MVSANIRFFLPIPPFGVTAYIFVLNPFRFCDGNLPGTVGATLREVLLATGIATAVFAVFSLLIVAVAYFLRALL